MARRANGEGTVFRRPDGRYEAKITYKDATGRTRRQSYYGKTSAEVRAKLKAALKRREDGSPVKDASRTVGEWTEQWTRTSLRASHRKVTTQALYTSC